MNTLRSVSIGAKRNEWRRDLFTNLSSIPKSVAASHRFVKRKTKTVAWVVSPRHGGTHVAPQWQPHMCFFAWTFLWVQATKRRIRDFLWFSKVHSVALKPQNSFLQTTKCRICDVLLLGALDPQNGPSKKAHLWLPLWRHVCATVARADDPRHGFYLFFNVFVVRSHKFCGWRSDL